MQIEPPLEPVSTSADLINPGAENPPWSGLDLLLIGLVLVAALFFFSSIFFIFSLRSSPSSGVSAPELHGNPGPLVIVPSMTLSYLAALGAMYVLVTRHRRRRFWQAVGWGWPSGWWVGYMVTGSMVAVVLGLLSRYLPIPKSLPMDRFFQNRQGAYVMMFFGVCVAPFAEEMLFRGFAASFIRCWIDGWRLC